jgi:hypothetical protein
LQCWSFWRTLCHCPINRICCFFLCASTQFAWHCSLSHVLVNFSLKLHFHKSRLVTENGSWRHKNNNEIITDILQLRMTSSTSAISKTPGQMQTVSLYKLGQVNLWWWWFHMTFGKKVWIECRTMTIWKLDFVQQLVLSPFVPSAWSILKFCHLVHKATQTFVSFSCNLSDLSKTHMRFLEQKKSIAFHVGNWSVVSRKVGRGSSSSGYQWCDH